MAYYSGYRRRSYRSWRSRGTGRSAGPSKYRALYALFGAVVSDIQSAFLALPEEALDELFSDYGAAHGDAAERYARKTYPSWKTKKTALSGQTLERLIELVPPYLEPEQRMELLHKLVKTHESKSTPYKTIRINVEAPAPGFTELEEALNEMNHEDVLAHLPENVMKAAAWLYDDDVTAARAMLSEAKSAENEMMKSQARKEIDLFRRTIASGQIKAATYSVTLPAGKLTVIAYEPKKGLFQTIMSWLN